MQLNIDFTRVVHTVENNNESQNHLEENEIHFNKQCEIVYTLLKSGARLSVREAMLYHGINSLPRRIMDLKTKNIAIKDEWVKPENGVKYKVYFL